MKMMKTVVAALLMSSIVAGVSGCKKEGPAERAGKEIDRAAEKAGREIEKAGDKMKDAIEQLKK